MPKARKARNVRETQPALTWIAPDLRVLARPISELRLDPKNARRHPDVNLAGIRASLSAHGQRKPIVVREGVVIAGNGTLEAAKALGWTHLACTEYDGPEALVRAYALADNRSAELATWDDQTLAAALLEADGAGLLEATSFTQADADAIVAEAQRATNVEPEPGEGDFDDLADGEDGAIATPFPWFGGKRKVAGEVWAALGDASQYVEPFAGSLAVLLRRPSAHVGRCATVNDLDAYVANFWRASHKAPDEVAEHADQPVNETDLEARHLWLVNEGRTLVERLRNDPDVFDAKVAGWWVWGICCWIGSGWCSGTGPHERPHLGTSGQGVNRKLPHLGTSGQGVNRKLPHLGNEGRGVNRQLPHLGDEGRGGALGSAPTSTTRDEASTGSSGREADRRANLVAYMRSLRDALRDVRVCCGDWSRVCTFGATAYGETVGVFLDPPYMDKVRTKGLYAQDGGGDKLAADVRQWALSMGDDPKYRIVLAGYEPEHEAHMPTSWRRVAWKAGRAYGTANGDDSMNRGLERLWLSPHCLAKPAS